MDTEQPDLDQMLAPLRSSEYDVTGGIPPVAHGHGHGGESVSIRTTEHAGHRIRVETRYRIFIDDQLFPDPIHVGDDGTVHYHGLPQYSLPSALDLCRRIAERIPAGGPPPPISGPGGGHHQHGDHPHVHGDVDAEGRGQ